MGPLSFGVALADLAIDDKPLKECTIVDCGELKEGEDDGRGDPDPYPDFPGLFGLCFFICAHSSHHQMLVEFPLRISWEWPQK